MKVVGLLQSDWFHYLKQTFYALCRQMGEVVRDSTILLKKEVERGRASGVNGAEPIRSAGRKHATQSGLWTHIQQQWKHILYPKGKHDYKIRKSMFGFNSEPELECIKKITTSIRKIFPGSFKFWLREGMCYREVVCVISLQSNYSVYIMFPFKKQLCH